MRPTADSVSGLATIRPALRPVLPQNRESITLQPRITALRAAADNALGFKNALEEAGYVLAKGDKTRK